MNSSGKIVGVDFSAPKPQSMTESHLSRREVHYLGGCCQNTTYDFISPDGAKHHADRLRSSCMERCCGWCACKQLYDDTKFKSESGPDFESKLTIECWRYCLCSCLDIWEGCCSCAQQCGKKHEILDGNGGTLGSIVHPTCWETICHCLFPGKNKVLLKTLNADGQEKYYIRSDSTYVYYKLPITAPQEQTPLGFVTVTGQRAFWCDGFLCCYCGLRKTAMLEVDHMEGLPFNERAHLMAAAMKIDDTHLLPYVGCLCNDP